MSKMRRSFRMLVLGVAVSGSAVFVLGETNNPYHQTEAAGLLTVQECLNCHNGSRGKAIHPCLGTECLYLENHSLLHSYPPARKPDKFASLAEIEAAGCVLEAGRITCLSCHDLTKPPPHLIRRGDQLCLICHKGQV